MFMHFQPLLYIFCLNKNSVSNFLWVDIRQTMYIELESFNRIIWVSNSCNLYSKINENYFLTAEFLFINCKPVINHLCIVEGFE